MYIAVNKIPGQAQQMVAAFKRALPDMKQFNGFLGLEIWEGSDGSVQAISRWSSKEALDEYLNHQTFSQHHGGASGSNQSHSNLISYYNCEVLS